VKGKGKIMLVKKHNNDTYMIAIINLKYQKYQNCSMTLFLLPECTNLNILWTMIFFKFNTLDIRNGIIEKCFR